MDKACRELPAAHRTMTRAEWDGHKRSVFGGGDCSPGHDIDPGANAIVFKTFDWMDPCFVGRAGRAAGLPGRRWLVASLVGVGLAGVARPSGARLGPGRTRRCTRPGRRVGWPLGSTHRAAPSVTLRGWRGSL